MIANIKVPGAIYILGVRILIGIDVSVVETCIVETLIKSSVKTGVIEATVSGTCVES